MHDFFGSLQPVSLYAVFFFKPNDFRTCLLWWCLNKRLSYLWLLNLFNSHSIVTKNYPNRTLFKRFGDYWIYSIVPQDTKSSDIFWWLLNFNSYSIVTIEFQRSQKVASLWRIQSHSSISHPCLLSKLTMLMDSTV